MSKGGSVFMSGVDTTIPLLAIDPVDSIIVEVADGTGK